jgi:hypothetical protein
MPGSAQQKDALMKKNEMMSQNDIANQQALSLKAKH